MVYKNYLDLLDELRAIAQLGLFKALRDGEVIIIDEK